MISQLISSLEHSSKTVAFTGAGISTLSGIKDFRGTDGLYLSQWEGLDVEEILSLSTFRSHPALFYRWAKDFVYNLDQFSPSLVHTVLSLMEKKGYLHAIYTQNIDMLHQKAGSKNVCELHGSPASHSCVSCNAQVNYEQVAPIVRKDDIPLCPLCQHVLKPNIIFYGEALQSSLLSQAYHDMAQSDVVLVFGSSLTVHPAASLPSTTVYHGGIMVIVNAQETSYDRDAKFRFFDLAQVCTSLQSWIEQAPSRHEVMTHS